MRVTGGEGGRGGRDVEVGDGPLGGEEGEREAESDKERAGAGEEGGGTVLEGAEEHCGGCGRGRVS